MIVLDEVTIHHPGADRAVLREVSCTLREGDLVLVAGPTGAGKSTLLRAVCGLVPHATGSHLSGRVLVVGRDTRTHAPRDLADVVGVVGQDPAAGFVTDHVEDELAFAPEQLGIAPDVMRKRIEEVLDLLGIADLRDRALQTLSGGEQQRVAIASVLTADPRVVVLDEPTSSLDPTAAEEVLATIVRLVHDLGVTAVVAEHRLERIAHYADQVLHLPGDGRIDLGAPASVLRAATVAPPLVHLGRAQGWDPVPLSVRDGRRAATGLRQRLTDLHGGTASASGPRAAGEVLLSGRGVTVTHGSTTALRGVDVQLRAGEVVALMGRNGAGKSSLLWALQGSGRRDGGVVDIAGEDPAELAAGEARRLVALVPQVAADLLYLPSVGEELAQADAETDSPSGTARTLLDTLVPDVADDSHPRDLSEGQRLALVLAIQLTAAPRVVLLDEPTRGLDEHAKAALADQLGALAADGRAVVLATHDVEVAAAVADRVVVLAEGEVVTHGPATHVLTASRAFAPQIAKVVAPHRLLTVADVEGAMTVDGADGGEAGAGTGSPNSTAGEAASDDEVGQ